MAQRSLHRVVLAVLLSVSAAACIAPSQSASVPFGGNALRSGAAPRWHVVRAGDTLGALARRYGVTVDALAAANGLRRPYTLEVGQQLSLPRGATDQARLYIVRPGDTLSTIAARFGTTVRALAVASDISDPDHVVAGQVLLVLPDDLVPRRAPSQPRRRIATGPPLLAPVDGEVVKDFAAAGGGLEIAGEARAFVRAAADGVVVYAGPGGTAGTAGIILLRHDDGGIGVYAGTGEIFVTHGERVQRGAVIARLPDRDRPRLRFELRENGAKIDPSARLSAMDRAEANRLAEEADRLAEQAVPAGLRHEVGWDHVMF